MLLERNLLDAAQTGDEYAFRRLVAPYPADLHAHRPALLGPVPRAAAQTGAESACRRLVAPYHADLHAHCYRMLGSVHDAEDALQDALLRAWRAIGRFEGRSGRAGARAGLCTVA